MFQYREREAVRLCLKHLRKLDYNDAFKALQQASEIQLEDPLLSDLHNLIVDNGDYNGAEEFINSSVNGKYEKIIYKCMNFFISNEISGKESCLVYEEFSLIYFYLRDDSDTHILT